MKQSQQVTNDQTQAYFDSIADTQGINAGSNADKYAVIKALLKDHNTHPSILEFGGGGGFYTRRFLMDNYQTTSIDLSKSALAENLHQAEKLGLSDQLTLINGDFIQEASRLTKQYDQVVFIKVLHHTPSLESIEQAITAGFQACRAGGQLVIFEPNGANILWKVFLSLIRDKESGKTKWFFEQNLRLTTVKKLSPILEKLNTDFSIQYHYILPGFLLEKNFFGAGALHAINRFLENSLFKKCAFNISFVIEKNN